MTAQIRLYLIISIATLSLVFSLYEGSTQTSLYQLWLNDHEQFRIILFQLRLPRTLTAFACGGLLSLSGALMQLLLQNPLADPYVLGISGGAALCTLLSMFFGIASYWLMGSAWLGSLLTMVIILSLGKKHRFEPHALLLLGIALACGFSACISFILIMSPDASVHSMLFWLMGDLNDAQFPWMLLSILGIGFIACLLLAPGLNILGRGDKESRALGLAAGRYRAALYFLSSLFTAAAVTFVGCIGFIGLIVPHLTRKLIGSDHRILLPYSLLLGGSLLTCADAIARTILAPQQLPVGIFMALIGIPIFIWLIQK